MSTSTGYTNQAEEMVARLTDARRGITEEVGKVIVGQRDVLDLLINSLMCGGHSLLVGVPGLAKTLLVSTLSSAFSLRFNRVQFVPDLMPSDITGSEVLDMDPEGGKREFRFIPGPVFCNVLLADEINRSSPKTQAALLQAMQERRVTVGGKTYELPGPFLVFATQNPIEQEGTYPLPEAELDRFMFQIDVDYPSGEEEVEMVRTTLVPEPPTTEVVLDAGSIVGFQGLVRSVPVPDHVAEFAVGVVRATRPDGGGGDGLVDRYLSWGAGPRASQFLVLGACARALLDGRYVPSVEDVRALAPPVLKHRIVLNFRAEAEGITPGDIISRVLEESR